jgi:3-dehydroquinate synthase class II
VKMREGVRGRSLAVEAGRPARRCVRQGRGVSFVSSLLARNWACREQKPAALARRRPRSQRRQAAVAALSPARPRLFWLEAPSKSAVTAGLEAGIDSFVFHPERAALLAECEAIAKFTAVAVDDAGDFRVELGAGFGGIRGTYAVCRGAGDVDALIARAGRSSKGEAFVMDAVDGWRVIPVENFIAAKQQAGCDAHLLVVSETVDEAAAMLGLLDVGVDGVVLRSGERGEIGKFAELMRGMQDRRLERDVGALSVGTVVDVRSAGSGDRVCVDCCSSMQADEMLLVGNSSGGLFGVQSEAVPNEYVETRPFRFNAGPLHHYALCPGGRTQYLSELKSGDMIVVVRPGEDGGVEARTATVGRCKVETRPLVLIVAETAGGRQLSLFMQNAETCRVATVLADGTHSGCSVVSLRRGDRVLLREDTRARHCGYAIEEYLVER